MTPLEFEQRVARIIKQLAAEGWEVAQDSHIPDPDNPAQPRQIDVTLRRGEKLVHVECRHHAKPQDTPWIETLIGRRISLNATSVIGVSSSGFTKGAVLKAKAHGIFLHQIDEITLASLKSWGTKTRVRFAYYEIFDPALLLVLDGEPERMQQELLCAWMSKERLTDRIFNDLRYELVKNNYFHYPYSFMYTLEAHQLDLHGQRVKFVKVRASINQYWRELSLPAVFSYQDVSHNPDIRAQVEASRDGGSEIIKAGSKIAVQIDMSDMPKPPVNSMFAGTIDFHARRPTQVPDVTIIGSPEHEIEMTDVSFSAVGG
jgi:hypothetical protein